MSKYRLINPNIQGNLNNKFTGDSGIDAAKNAWDTISKYITNNVPKFGFTLENLKDGSLHHFSVKEDLEGEYAKYDIQELNIKMKSDDLNKFKSKVAKSNKNMSGGKKHKDKDDDSSSSSSTSDYLSSFKYNRLFNYPQPIVYWWYDPYIYSFDSVYIPTFVAPLTPYIEIATINYYPY
jgi:hypothetical protein